MAKAIGFSRAIKIEWLNKVAELVCAGQSEAEIKSALNEYLAFEISSPTNLRKTREILMNTWVYQPEDGVEIRKAAIEAYRCGTGNVPALHWCMLMLSYPIFKDICGLIGKVTTVQGDFVTAWLKKSLAEIWGERTTLLHSTDKILQTLKNFEVIENSKVGVYTVKKYPVADSMTLRVIVMSILALKERAYYEMADFSSVAQMFPFEFVVSHEWLYHTGYFEVSGFGGKAVIVAG